MSVTVPHLNWLRSFECAARHLSFAVAARELNLTPAAVSQQVRALEHQLGAALFERLPRGIRLTAHGYAYLPAVRKALGELSVATAGLFGGRVRRAVTLRSTMSFAALCLSPALGRLRAALPGVELHLFASIWGDDLDDDRVDVEIRYGHGQWDGFDARRLTAPVSVPACPPGTDFGADPAVALARMMGAGVVQVMGYEMLWTRLADGIGVSGPVVTGSTADTSLLALEMVAAGAGPAMIARDLARHHHAAGRVAIPPGFAVRHDQAHHLLMPRRSRAPRAEALMLRDWLIRSFAEPD